MTAPAVPRRGFLSGLATLPLIGGSVALIGQPTAAAVPVTDTLLDAYDHWLDLERSFLRWHRFGKSDAMTPLGPNMEVVFRDRRTGKVWDISAGCSFGFDHSSPVRRPARLSS